MDIIPKNDYNLKEILQNLIYKEFEQYVERLRAKNPNCKIYKNGYYEVNYNSELGNIVLKVPRLRNFIFKSEILSKSSYSNKIVKMCIVSYGHGLSTARISAFAHEVFGLKISKSTVSSFCEKLNDNVEAYFKNISESIYEVIMIDAKYFSVRSLSKNKSALISAIGITKEGKKEHIYMEIIQREGKIQILNFLENLKQRLHNKKPLIIIDGVESMPSAIKEVFGDVAIQRCLVHVVRNIKHNLKGVATKGDINEIETRLNNLFFDTCNEDVYSELENILHSYPRYINKLKNVLRCENIFTYLRYSDKVASMIKTNNGIEQFHANLEAVTKQHRTYHDRDSLYRAIILEIERYNYIDNDIISFELKIINEVKQIKYILAIFKQTEHIILKIVSSGKTLYDGKIRKSQLEQILLIL